MVKFIHYMILAFICFSNYPISFAHDSNNLYKKLYKLVLPRAKQGDIQSQFNLGKMYQQGLGISIDLQKAAKYLNYQRGSFPKAEYQSKNLITLPVHQYLNKKHFVINLTYSIKI